MNSIFLRAFAALLTICPCAIRAAGFEPGPRPSVAVFDPHGILNADERLEISTSLGKILKDERVEVIAVVLENSDLSDPEVLATGMAEKWCESFAHAVVLHVPGREGTPWIAAGGELIRSIDPNEVRDELAAARRDASREADDISKIRTAANAAADMLRYWKGREVNRRAVIENERTLIRLELETKSRRQQIVMLTAAAAAVPLIAGVMLAVRLLGRTRRVTARKS
jgi:hypothetical protein